MTEAELLAAATEAIVATDEDQAKALARQAVEMGLDPIKVINEGFSLGMRKVGDLFERGQMFLPEVIIASEAMVASVAILEENLPQEQKDKKAGIAVLGTIEGDVHDIGKGIVATLLRVYGFEVHDLGRDVPLTTFVEKAKETHANIVGTSALMTTTMVGQKAAREAPERSGHPRPGEDHGRRRRRDAALGRQDRGRRLRRGRAGSRHQSPRAGRVTREVTNA